MKPKNFALAFLQSPVVWFYVCLLVFGTLLSRWAGQQPGIDLTDGVPLPTRDALHPILAVIATIVVAIFLFSVRQRFPKWYSAGEAAAGVVVVVVGISKPDAQNAGHLSLAGIAAVVGGIYLMIRAFDNWNRPPMTESMPCDAREPARPAAS